MHSNHLFSESAPKGHGPTCRGACPCTITRHWWIEVLGWLVTRLTHRAYEVDMVGVKINQPIYPWDNNIRSDNLGCTWWAGNKQHVGRQWAAWSPGALCRSKRKPQHFTELVFAIGIVKWTVSTVSISKFFSETKSLLFPDFYQNNYLNKCDTSPIWRSCINNCIFTTEISVFFN